MKSNNKFLSALVIVFTIFCGLVYVIVTLAPVVACLLTLFMAVCTSENHFLIVGVVIVTSLFLTLIASPFIRPFFETKKLENNSSESPEDDFDK